jgi:hypothetical protein
LLLLFLFLFLFLLLLLLLPLLLWLPLLSLLSCWQPPLLLLLGALSRGASSGAIEDYCKPRRWCHVLSTERAAEP